MAMKRDSSEILELLMKKGVHGDAATMHNWLELVARIIENPLPGPLSDFHDQYLYDISHYYGTNADVFRSVNREETEIILKKFVESGRVIQVPPYNEYRWHDLAETTLADHNVETFFAGTWLELNPLQYVRSRIANFCQYRKVSEKDLEDLIISITEATENAVKYSGDTLFAVRQTVENNECYISIINSLRGGTLQEEIDRGKFSEDVSLMRGVLVMTKLLDDLEIDRDEEKSRVCFKGKKRVSFHNL